MSSNNVCLFLNAWNSFLWVPLAERIKLEKGGAVFGISSKTNDAKWFQAQDTRNVLDEIISIEDLEYRMTRPEAEPSEILSKARRHELQYGFLYVDVLQIHRHLGRGYAAGAPFFPRSVMSSKADWLTIVHALNEIVEYWAHFFRDKSIGCLVNSGGGLAGFVAVLMAEHFGIRHFVPNWSKYLDYYHWANGRFLRFPQLSHTFEGISRSAVPEHVDFELPMGEKRAKQHVISRFTVKGLLKGIFRQTLIRAYQKVKRIEGPAKYMLSSEISLMLRGRRDFLSLRKMKFVSPKEARRFKYVFLPLSLEPEGSLSVHSPEFNEQLAMIELVAKNLPIDHRLVVKEHIYALGTRPSEFYQTISQIPNAVLADCSADAVEYLQSCSAVIIITGTLGFEAAVHGVPVIAFGQHNMYDFLDHFYVIRDFTTIRTVLENVCAQQDRQEIEQRCLDGSRLLQAVIQSSFRFDKLKLSHYNKDFKLNAEDLDTMANHLFEAMRMEPDV